MFQVHISVGVPKLCMCNTISLFSKASGTKGRDVAAPALDYVDIPHSQIRKVTSTVMISRNSIIIDLFF